jgi:hypothetical protein
MYQSAILGDKNDGLHGWADLLILKQEVDGMVQGVRPKLESHSAFRTHFLAKDSD